MAGKRKQQPKEWNPSPRIRAFLAAYRLTCSITKAAKAAGVRREAHYRLMERSPDYKVAFNEATVIAADALEDEALRRGREGLLKPKFYHGELVMVPKNPADPECKVFVPYLEREYSDQLLITVLKAKKPEQYRDRVEHELGDKTVKRFEGTMEDLLALYRKLTTPEEDDDK